MAKKRKRRSSLKGRKSRKERLKDNFYKATIVGMMADPDGTDPQMAKVWQKAVDDAVAGGVSFEEMQRLIKKVQKDAEAINDFLDEHPDMLVKVEGQGWVVDTEGDA